MTALPWVEDDGGRAASGFKGFTGDCVVRAIAIATGDSYREVYDALHRRTLNSRSAMAKLELRYGKNARTHASPRTGVLKAIYRDHLRDQGWLWTPTMPIGQGTKVHLAEDELVGGTLLVNLSRHLTCVKDRVTHDTYDPSRDGTRCVYGVWTEPGRPTPFFIDGQLRDLAWDAP